MRKDAEVDGPKSCISSLLEFAASNDVVGFKKTMGSDVSAVDAMGLWYGRGPSSKRVALEHKTPLMVAATYGSVEIVKFVLSLSEVDVNRPCVPEKSTALHFAASGGSADAADVVELLLRSGADIHSTDVHGRRPSDVIVVPPNLPSLRVSLEQLLKVRTLGSKSSSPALSSSSDNGSCVSSSSDLMIPLSINTHVSSVPIHPFLPDIKNTSFASDEFRMFSFKVRPCSRAYSHDWTECPFVHPGENARRRDPRKFHYSCVPCPDFRKGACRHGDLCEYAHGVFECWLHPAQYRTRLCKDGTSCDRRVCFFAHKVEELRPLHGSTGCAAPSPRRATSTTTMDMAAAIYLPTGTPSAASLMSPSPFSPPISPSSIDGISHPTIVWPQPNIPPSNPYGSNLQSSRLMSSLHARDFGTTKLYMLQDFEQQQQQLLNNLSNFSHPHLSSSSTNKLHVQLNPLSPNFDEFLSAELSSPRFADQVPGASVLSPTHKSMVLNHLQQKQSMLSLINTNAFPTKSVASYGVPSTGRMSPGIVDHLSPKGLRSCFFAHNEKQQLQQQISHSSRDLRSSLPRDIYRSNDAEIFVPPSPWSNWETSNGEVDWSVKDELGPFLGPFSDEHGLEEPDVSWVQSLVKDSQPEVKEMLGVAASRAPASG